MIPCTLKLLPGSARGILTRGAQSALHDLVREGAHLVGEAVFVSSIFFCGDGDTPCGLLEVLSQSEVIGIRELNVLETEVVTQG